MATSSDNRPEEAIAASEFENASTATYIKFPNKPFPHSMLLVFEKYDYSGFASGFDTQLTNTTGAQSSINPNRQSGIGLRSTSSIELPFPKQLTDTTGLIYNNMQQNPLIEGLTQRLAAYSKGTGGGTIGDIPGQIQGIGADAAKAFSGMGGGTGAAITSMANRIAKTNNSDAASTAMYLLQKYLPENIGKSVNLAAGQVLNPRETIAFEGVSLKTHSFTWDLYPSNKKDSARIQDIIKHMKAAILPKTRNLGPADNGIKSAFLQFPQVCKIYLIGINEDFYMKSKPAMVTNMTVDYGAGGNLAIMAGGVPAGVSISITLQELQIETAHDYGVAQETSIPASAPTDPEVESGAGDSAASQNAARGNQQ